VIGRHIEAGCTRTSITNNSLNRYASTWSRVRADFADIFEVKSNDILRRGRITTTWSEKQAAAAGHVPDKTSARSNVRAGEGDGEPTVNAKEG